MVKLAAVFALSSVVLLASPASAQSLTITGAPVPATPLISAEHKKLLEQALKIQQARVDELSTISANARASAAQLDVNAKASDKSAQALQDQGKGFRDAGVSADKDTKKKLDELADECDAYAKRDHHFADDMRDAAKILLKQADGVDKAIEAHKKTIAGLKVLLGK